RAEIGDRDADHHRSRPGSPAHLVEAGDAHGAGGAQLFLDRVTRRPVRGRGPGPVRGGRLIDDRLRVRHGDIFAPAACSPRAETIDPLDPVFTFYAKR